jgi:hypothetical protein
MATHVSPPTHQPTMNSIQLAREEALETAIAQARATTRIEGKNPIQLIIALLLGFIESVVHRL